MNATRGPEELPEIELLPGERVLWSGRPNVARREKLRDRGTAVFAYTWIGVLVVWWAVALPAALRGDMPPIALVGTLPHVLLGVWLAWGRNAYNARLKERLSYAVTDRRVIEVERTSRGPRVIAVELRNVRRIDETVREDGSGSVMFHKDPFPLGGGRRTFDRRTMLGPVRGSPDEVLFYDVPDARRVLEIVGARWEPPPRPAWLPTSAWTGFVPRTPDPGEGPDVTAREVVPGPRSRPGGGPPGRRARRPPPGAPPSP